MKLIEIDFPVFCIKDYDRIFEEGKITYIEKDEIIKMVDNKYLLGNTLGERRLRIEKDQRYPLKYCLLNYYQLLKSGCKVFIDNSGKVIKYKKYFRAKLTYHRIREHKQVEDVGYIIYLEDIGIPLEVPASVYNYQNYVGLLHYNRGYLVYEFSDTKKSTTWRMI